MLAYRINTCLYALPDDPLYTNITELTEELLHTLIEKVVVHEKEVIDGETVMRIDIYDRFIGKVGSENGETLKATKSRRASIPLAPGA